MTDHPTQHSESTLCPNCGYPASSRAIVCKICGTSLSDLPANSTETAIMPRPNSPVDLYDEPLDPVGTSRFSPGSILYLSVERVNSPITRYVREESILLGRGDTTPLNRYDINLSPYSARERGVSRRHAQIYFYNGELYLEDLDSSNGTLVNGEPLTPNLPHKLHDGDEILLGRMMLWVNF